MAVANSNAYGFFISNGDFGLIREVLGEVEERSVKLDLFALMLAACTVFLTLTLLTYSPADPE